MLCENNHLCFIHAVIKNAAILPLPAFQPVVVRKTATKMYGARVGGILSTLSYLLLSSLLSYFDMHVCAV